MSASYPTSTKSFSTKVDGNTVSAAHVNDLQDEVVAVETGLRDGLAHDLKFTDASYDIGKSGATRPRDLFLSRNATVGGTVTATGVVSAPGLPVLLHADSGTDTGAGATTVDSVAITGLTAKDTLMIEVTLESISQATAGPTIRHVTDAATICQLTTGGASIAAAGIAQGTTKVRQRQGGATKLAAFHSGFDPTTTVTTTNTWNTLTATTDWTGSWTLGLHHGGVTSGGTFQWSWAVFVLKGQ